MILAIALGAWGCGSDGGGGADAEVTQDVVEEGPGEVEVQIDVKPEAEVPEVPQEEVTPPECTEDDYAAVCPAILTPGPDQCHEYFCDLSQGGGKCAVKAKKDGADCDDGQICTSGDSCQQGACESGPSVCDCTKVGDTACDPKAGDNLCLGTKKCDLDHFPYKCIIDVLTVPAPCGKDQDTFCKVSQCDPVDGKCKMTPTREGETCEDNKVCTEKTTCQAGECLATPDGNKVCDDHNPCTDDKCDNPLGCTYTPNTLSCDDGDACTENDTCKASKCQPGTPKVCDNGLYCDGVETCDKALGCQDGADPTCDDGIPCTTDSCDATLNGGKGGCRHEAIPTAIEGPKGDPTCSDTIDNDCSGKADAADPACAFSVTGVIPPEGPSAGGSVVEIVGESFDLIPANGGEVLFANIEVPFEVLSATRIRITTPPHETNDVPVMVSTGKISYQMDDAFRYTGLTDLQTINAVTLDPVTWEMDEGSTTKPYTVQVYVQGLTDLIDPPPDPSLVKAQIGWGQRGTNPWEDPSWQWLDLGAPVDTTGGAFTYVKAFAVAVGGYFDVAPRFSLDGGMTFAFGDQDGSLNGYDAAMASTLTVWGVSKPGAVVINEIMWMGSKGNTYDEWLELRNMGPAPFRLNGFKVTKAAGGNPPADFVLQDPKHTVNNLVLDPWGYYLIAEYDSSYSALAVEPDVVGNNTMVLLNTAPVTYQLVSGSAVVLDSATYSGKYGEASTVPDKPYKSMERKAVPGDGTKDANWQTAYAHTGWDGDPKQVLNWGTPRAPNSDIPVCASDDECEDAFPGIPVGQCERKACGTTSARCDIVEVADGEACDDGKFCNVGETCSSGTCGGGAAMDCADESACTLDTCDEAADACKHAPDPAAVEGPAGAASCSDGVDNDCDDLVDESDPQCLLELDALAPAVVPVVGGWEVVLTGYGFKVGDADFVTSVTFKDLPAVLFTVVDDMTISAIVPAMAAPGDYDVTVSDGLVNATLVKGIRYIGKDETIWGNTQGPAGDIAIAVGHTTPVISGRVLAPGVTDADPPNPDLVIAEIGIGPAIDPGVTYPDPFAEPGWTWFPATYNADCWANDCGLTKFEYAATLKPDQVGTYLVVFRYSIDGGYSFQYGDRNGSDDAWSPVTSLVVDVQTTNVPADHTDELAGILHPPAPGRTDPLVNCVACHGSDLKGDTGPSCYMCHTSADHAVDPNASGVMHKAGDSATCTTCHGPANAGGMGPSCTASGCHTP
jgi:hypothetical protein